MDGHDGAGYDGPDGEHDGGHGGYGHVSHSGDHHGLSHDSHGSHDHGSHSHGDNPGNEHGAMPGLFTPGRGPVCPLGFAMGYFGNALQTMGLCNAGVPEVEANNESGVRRIRLPGVVGKGRTLQTLVYPHADIDVDKILEGICSAHGLMRLEASTSAFADYLKDTTPFDGKDSNSSMPSGWYQGATGFTKTFQQFWQIPSKKNFWSKPAATRDNKTHLSVSGATWYFNETGDYESRVAITVSSLPYSDCGIWKEWDEQIKRHLAISWPVSEALYKRLKGMPSREHCQMIRQMQADGERARLLNPGFRRTVVGPDNIVGPAPEVLTTPGPLGRATGSKVLLSDPITTMDMSGKA